MKRLLPFAVLLIAAACSDGAAPFAPTTESSVLLASRIAAAKADKMDVCHIDDMGNYKLINVSTNAWKAHEGHGDKLPGANGCSEAVVTLTFLSVSEVYGQIFWTVDGTPGTVSFVIQQALGDPESPATFWNPLETVSGIVPGSFSSENFFGSGTYRIVATLSDASQVVSLPITIGGAPPLP